MHRSILAGLVLAGVVVAAAGFAVSEHKEQPAPGGYTPLPKLAQETLSPHCSTSVGVCDVAPQPIGSPCVCGDVPGSIIP
jgi:hypothetical protein